MDSKRKMPMNYPTNKRVKKYTPKLSVSRIDRHCHSFKRNFALFTISGNAAFAPYQSNTNITLNQVINATEFTSLFDQYRIKYCVTKFWLRTDPGAQVPLSATFPRLYWCRDQNSQVVLSQNEMRERGDLKIAVLHPDRPVVVKFKPNVLTQQFLSGVSTCYTPAYDQWIDTASPGAIHYGVLYNIDDLTNTNYRVDIETTVYFECKDTR